MPRATVIAAIPVIQYSLPPTIRCRRLGRKVCGLSWIPEIELTPGLSKKKHQSENTGRGSQRKRQARDNASDDSPSPCVRALLYHLPTADQLRNNEKKSEETHYKREPEDRHSRKLFVVTARC